MSKKVTFTVDETEAKVLVDAVIHFKDAGSAWWIRNEPVAQKIRKACDSLYRKIVRGIR